MAKFGKHGTKYEELIRQFLDAAKSKLGAPHDFSVGDTTIQFKYSKCYPVRPVEAKAKKWNQAYIWVWDDLFGDSGINNFAFLLLGGVRPNFDLSNTVDDLQLFLLPRELIFTAANGRNRIECQTEITTNCRKITRLVHKHETDKEQLLIWAAGLKSGTSRSPSPVTKSQQGSLFV
jgi:hypothetical protein